jgi:hypothetical protein
MRQCNKFKLSFIKYPSFVQTHIILNRYKRIYVDVITAVRLEYFFYFLIVEMLERISNKRISFFILYFKDII